MKLQWSTETQKTMDLIGCSIEELKNHIEVQFREGMSWDNYGRSGWVIDHIKPCAAFKLLLESEQIKCFHWSNLRPLWESENGSKGSLFNGKYIRKDA